MERIELKAVMYTDRPGVLDDDLVDLGAVDFAVLRQDEIWPNARGEYLATEIEPAFAQATAGPPTQDALVAKLDAVKAALYDAALLLLAVKDPEDADDSWYESEVYVCEDDADEGLGLLAEAWEALEFGGHAEFIDEALKRGGYTPSEERIQADVDVGEAEGEHVGDHTEDISYKLDVQRCVLCGEPGADAEMYDEAMHDDPDLSSEAEAGPVHAECGLAKGWAVA